MIKALSGEWKPDEHKDRYRGPLRKVVQSKSKGETITLPEADEATEAAPDIMEALKRTLKELQRA